MLKITHGLAWLLMILLMARAGYAGVGNHHVRLVLDTSQSMIKRDKPKNAILATLLLRDLADSNVSAGDSFAVIPFDGALDEKASYQWTPGGPPPEHRGVMIRLEHRKRADFIRQITRLKNYKSKCTYFYPVLKKAIEDLKRKIDQDPYSTRTLVLLTDGVPDKPKVGGTYPCILHPAPLSSRELKRIQRDLAPEMIRHGINFYVLAYGSEADKHHDFFDAMRQANGGVVSGESFSDPNGDKILNQMAAIYSRSFGYWSVSSDTASPSNPEITLNLNQGQNPSKVAVVAFNHGLQSTQNPKLEIKPTNKTRYRPTAEFTHKVTEPAYALHWSTQPDEGQYTIKPTPAGDWQIEVLHPVKIHHEIVNKNQSTGKHTWLTDAMAGVPYSAYVMATSLQGGNPPPLDVKFRYQYPTPNGMTWSQPGSRYTIARALSRQAAITQNRTGDLYEMVIEAKGNAGFPRNEQNPAQKYRAIIQTEIKYNGIIQGDPKRKTEVNVWPYLKIETEGERNIERGATLLKNKTGCTRFNYRPDPNTDYHWRGDEEEYTFHAAIAPPANNSRWRDAMKGATFTLDRKPVWEEASAANSSNMPTNSGAWEKQLTFNELIQNSHELCIKLGKPATGGRFDLPLKLTVNKTPYDLFNVIDPFTAKVRIQSPNPWEQWAKHLALMLLVLLLPLAFWYIYALGLPRFTNDFIYWIKEKDHFEDKDAQALPKSAFWRRWLLLSDKTPLFRQATSSLPVAWLLAAPGKGGGVKVRLAFSGDVSAMQQDEEERVEPDSATKNHYPVTPGVAYALRSSASAEPYYFMFSHKNWY